MDQNDFIQLRGVRTNNLKSVSVELPLGCYTVVTGVSGSGKSSLVFDTLYGESYRRYVESLSSFARQYLKALPKCDIDQVLNMPPAIAVQQTRSGASSRSTVGTLTELIDMFRVLFVHLGEEICPDCKVVVRRDRESAIIVELLAQHSGQNALILAPLNMPKKVKIADYKAQIEAMGFSRFYLDGEVVRIEDIKATGLKSAALVIDRVKVNEEHRSRLMESLQLSFKVGRGHLMIVAGEEKKLLRFSTELRCNHCLREFVVPSVALLNFNHPLGACSHCQGFGRAVEIDPLKVIPDPSSCLAEHGVAPWNFGKHVLFYKWALQTGKQIGIDPRKPFANYTEEELKWLYAGDEQTGFEGIDGYFAYLDRKRYKPHYRIHAARFRKYVTCPQCHGARLNSDSLSLSIMGKNIADISTMPVNNLKAWVDQIAHEAPQSEAQTRYGITAAELTIGVSEAIEELEQRLSYLLKVGLKYLTLERTARTLSGGELQRVNLARSLGSALTGTLFCLDEPSSGLHARDSKNLLNVIDELIAQGNTVVVVEHEKTLIDHAQHLLEIGPAAGHLGGEVVYAGHPSGWVDKVTPRWPRGAIQKDFASAMFLELCGVKTHNLQDVNVKIPLSKLTVVCGVSGSGKSSLISATLYPALAQVLGQKLDGIEIDYEFSELNNKEQLCRHLDEVVHVGQKTIGRSTRSNIATYLGIFDEIRKLLADTPLARGHKLKPTSFSFNTPGGRCEACKGLGTVVEDLSFLGEMAIKCPSCGGKRFDDKVLEVTYRDKSMLDILNLTIIEASEFFFDRPQIVAALLGVIEMGLGYITLGQHTSSFSGGEAQRLKLLNILDKRDNKKSKMLIFDEPTTGLSDRDVVLLIAKLRNLVDEGHTVVVVEHHLGIIRAADWLIEVGPEAAQEGGKIVYQGVVDGVMAASASRTAPFLKLQS